MTSDLTTYQIYLILLGYLTERRDDTQMLKSMLIELYTRAAKAESEDKCKNCKYYPNPDNDRIIQDLHYCEPYKSESEVRK